MTNLSDVNLDKLTLENVGFQFCSDFLKDQIVALIKERDAATKRLADVEADRDTWKQMAETWKIEHGRLKAALEKTKQDMHLVVSDAGKGLIAERDRYREALEALSISNSKEGYLPLREAEWVSEALAPKDDEKEQNK